MKWTATSLLCLSVSLLLPACGGGSSSDIENEITLVKDDSLIFVPPAPQRVTIDNDAEGNIVLNWEAAEKPEIQETSGRSLLTYKVYWSTLGSLDLENKRDFAEVSNPPFVHKDLSLGTPAVASG